MEILFANTNQRMIANLLWQAQDQGTVNQIRRTYGHDAEVAYHMLVAATLDSVTDTDLADEALEPFLGE